MRMNHCIKSVLARKTYWIVVALISTSALLTVASGSATAAPALLQSFPRFLPGLLALAAAVLFCRCAYAGTNAQTATVCSQSTLRSPAKPPAALKQSREKQLQAWLLRYYYRLPSQQEQKMRLWRQMRERAQYSREIANPKSCTSRFLQNLRYQNAAYYARFAQQKVLAAKASTTVPELGNTSTNCAQSTYARTISTYRITK
jgi:hypothetical protein